MNKIPVMPGAVPVENHDSLELSVVLSCLDQAQTLPEEALRG